MTWTKTKDFAHQGYDGRPVFRYRWPEAVEATRPEPYMWPRLHDGSVIVAVSAARERLAPLWNSRADVQWPKPLFEALLRVAENHDIDRQMRHAANLGLRTADRSGSIQEMEIAAAAQAFICGRVKPTSDFGNGGVEVTFMPPRRQGKSWRRRVAQALLGK